MPRDEILVPKEIREFMLDGAEETFLGKKMAQKNSIDMVIYTLENMKINFWSILTKLIHVKIH